MVVLTKIRAEEWKKYGYTRKYGIKLARTYKIKSKRNESLNDFLERIKNADPEREREDNIISEYPEPLVELPIHVPEPLNSNYINILSIIEQINNANIEGAFSLELTSATTDIKKTFNFKNKAHFEHWANNINENKSYSHEVEIADNYFDKDIFAWSSYKLRPIIGGCRKDTSKEIKSVILNEYVLELFNTYSNNNNCGIVAVNDLTEYINPQTVRVMLHLSNKQELTYENVIDYYRFTECTKPLIIIDSSFDGIMTNNNNYIYYNNRHYTAVKSFTKKEINTKNVLRGELYYDCETRPTEEFKMIGSTKSFILRDTITHVWYRDYKSTTFKSFYFETNEKSSMRQFIDFLKQQAYNNKFYNCVAHNSSRFDNYFVVNNLTEDELLSSKISLRGYAIIGLSLFNHTFHDSYCFLTYSLKKLCQSFKIEDSKKTSFDLHGITISNEQLCFYKPELTFAEFMDLKNTDTEFWTLYNDYCLYDCISLQQIWSRFTENTHSLIKKISPYLLNTCNVNSCNTIGSLSKKLFINTNKYGLKWTRDMERYLLFDDDPDKNKFLCKFKRGGISHCAQAGKHSYPVCSTDITSQYPASMVHMLVPCGYSYWTDNYDPSVYGYYEVVGLRFADTKNAMHSLKFKPLASSSIGSLDWLNINTDEKYYIDSFMLKYLKQHCGLISFDVVKGLVSKQRLEGSKLFGAYINTLFSEKDHQDTLKDSGSSDYNQAYREVIKLFMNSLSGKMVEDTSKYFDITFDPESQCKIGSVGCSKEYKQTYNEFVGLGVMIYSYSKRLLFEYIRMLPNKEDNVIHVETDSIYFPKECFQTFSDNIAQYYGPYPVALGPKLGNMKMEKDTTEDSYFLGKKFYYIAGTCKIKGFPCSTIDEHGSKVTLITKDDYISYYNGHDIKKEFCTMVKKLYGNTYISSHRMTRTIKSNTKNALHSLKFQHYTSPLQTHI